MLGVKPSYSTGFAQWPGMSEYPQLWEGLVGAWDASLGITGGKLLDLSGNGNNGTISNCTWTSGKYGSDLTFASGDYIGIVPKSSPVSQVTIIAWLKSTGVGIQTILEWRDGAGYNDGIWFAVDLVQGADSRIYFYTRGLGVHGGDLVGSGNLNDGRYHLFAVTWDGATIRYFWDGQCASEVDAAVGTLTYTGDCTQIGLDFASGYPFIGSISSVYMSDRALLASEIALLYHLMKRLAA